MSNSSVDVPVYQRLANNISQVITGQNDAIRKLLAALFSHGHILLEDVPGTGKTTLAKALAQSVNAEFRRIQFTPDLLPTDITGVSVFDQRDQSFHFHEGPVFSHILLADEINRASPRTQSALLEAMAEQQVSVDGKVRQLPDLFFVMATQNPIEYHGTYPLPEAQMDRFAMRFQLGYVSADDEVAILSAQNQEHPLKLLTACTTLAEIQQQQKAVSNIRVADNIKRYIVDLIRASRTYNGVRNGASPRAGLALMKATQALAMFDGLDYVTPDHVQEIAVAVLAHRLLLDSEGQLTGLAEEAVINDLLQTVHVPV
ncbi:MAG: MoxR family ATPase [Gammaproteobacteria bacterium]